MSITRRQVIMGGIVTALAAAKDLAAPFGKALLSDSRVPSESEEGSRLEISNKSKIEQAPQASPVQLRLIHSTDKNFDATLDNIFPGLRQHKRFIKIRPFSAVLINTATKPIYGYTLRWRAISKVGVKDSYHRHFFRSPSVQLGTRQVTGQKPLLAPGAMALVTPFFFWPAATDKGAPSQKKLSRRKWNDYKSAGVRAHGFVMRHVRTVNLNTSMHARVYSSKARGSRAGVAAKLYRHRRNAEHDQAYSFLVHCIGTDGFLDPKLLQAKITSATEYFHGAARGSEQRQYFLARVRFAQRVKFCVGAYGIERTWQILQDVNAMPPTTIRVSKS
jgi:hypothetical protein